MRILYKPERFVVKCSICSTVMEFEVNELRFEDDNDRIFSRLGFSISCPTCRTVPTTKDIVKPELSLQVEGKNCESCKSALGKDDNICPNCGFPVRKVVV